MTPKQFKAKAEKMFLNANPGAVINEWRHGPVRVTWANGAKGISGVFHAGGEGWRPREVCASLDNHGFSVG